MRSILNPGSSLTNPAELFIRWNGAVEKIKDADGNVNQEGGYLYYDDKDNDYETVRVPFPLMLYPLGESMSVRGGVYDGANKANNTFCSSNEFGGWDEPITVYERHIGDTSGTVIARGVYNDIKDTIKAHKAKIGSNLYALCNLDGKSAIVRLELNGGAGRALSDYRKKCGAKFYDQPLIIKGAEIKTNGTVTYAVPKFCAGDQYDDTARKGLEDYAKTICEYGNALQQKNMNNASKAVITDETSDEEYDAEINQEPQDEEPTVDLSGVPF